MEPPKPITAQQAWNNLNPLDTRIRPNQSQPPAQQDARSSSVSMSCIEVSIYVRSKAQTSLLWGSPRSRWNSEDTTWSFCSSWSRPGDMLTGSPQDRSFLSVPLNCECSSHRNPKNCSDWGFAPSEASSAPASRRSCRSWSDPQNREGGPKLSIKHLPYLAEQTLAFTSANPKQPWFLFLGKTNHIYNHHQPHAPQTFWYQLMWYQMKV